MDEKTLKELVEFCTRLESVEEIVQATTAKFERANHMELGLQFLRRVLNSVTSHESLAVLLWHFIVALSTTSTSVASVIAPKCNHPLSSLKGTNPSLAASIKTHYYSILLQALVCIKRFDEIWYLFL
jgi:hypothetical protein